NHWRSERIWPIGNEPHDRRAIAVSTFCRPDSASPLAGLLHCVQRSSTDYAPETEMDTDAWAVPHCSATRLRSVFCDTFSRRPALATGPTRLIPSRLRGVRNPGKDDRGSRPAWAGTFPCPAFALYQPGQAAWLPN